MDVLIIVPRFVKNCGDFYHFPLGLAYIASAVRQAGHRVHGLNLNHFPQDPAEVVAAEVARLKPDVCATGSLSPFLPGLKTIFAAARQAKRDIVNIAGGGVVSADPDVILDLLDIDVGVIGEGEQTIVELLDCYQHGRDLAGVDGIVFRNRAGLPMRTHHRASVMDLTQIAWPDYESLGYEEHLHLQRPLDVYFFQTQPENRPRAIDMVSSRSCPYSCTFCFHPAGKVYRERPLDEFFAELETLIARYNVNMVEVIDELFSLRKARLFEFCERIKPLNLQWIVQLHVNSADEDILDAMKDSGCTVISYGIESMSPEVLVSMQKKSKRPRIEETLQRTYDRHIGIQGNLIFGDTAETLETANDSMHWWARNRRYQVYINRLLVFPGSPDYIQAVRDGLITDRLNYVDVLPTDINISKMNDKNLQMLCVQLSAHDRSLLNLAPVVSFEESAEQVPGRAKAYDIDWDCPRCRHRNEYRGCVMHDDLNKPHLRLFCRGCLSRCDIRNAAFVSPEKDELEEQDRLAYMMAATQLAEAGETERAWNLLSKALTLSPGFGEAWAMIAGIYAQIGNPELALRTFDQALKHEPFVPRHHVQFGDFLLGIGAVGAARMHYEQALALDPGIAGARARIDLIDGPSFTDAQRATYFISWSSEEPRYRASRDAGGYDRKREPAFPVFGRSENRASLDRVGA